MNLAMHDHVRRRRERTCRVREPVGDCHPLSMIACTECRPRWHHKRSKVSARPRSSLRSTTRTLRTSHVVMHPPRRPRETVSITKEASTSTLWWVERECAAVVVVLLFTLSLSVLSPLTCTCTLSIWLKKKALHCVTIFSPSGLPFPRLEFK